MQKKENGFSVVEIILVVLVVILAGALGWVFFNNQKDAKTADDTTMSETQSKPAEKTNYTLDNAIADINDVLASKGCVEGGDSYPVDKADVTTVSDTEKFHLANDQSSLINKDLTYAYANYGCGGGEMGGAPYAALLNRSDDGWTIVSSYSRNAGEYPLCSEIRGKGFPSSIIDSCVNSRDDQKAVKI